METNNNRARKIIVSKMEIQIIQINLLEINSLIDIIILLTTNMIETRSLINQDKGNSSFCNNWIQDYIIYIKYQQMKTQLKTNNNLIRLDLYRIITIKHIFKIIIPPDSQSFNLKN